MGMRKGASVRRLLVRLIYGATYAAGIFGVSFILGSYAGWLVGN
jgi:hypothetical protein